MDLKIINFLPKIKELRQRKKAEGAKHKKKSALAWLSSKSQNLKLTWDIRGPQGRRNGTRGGTVLYTQMMGRLRGEPMCSIL